MKAQKLRGRENILSARIATLLVFATLLLSSPLAQAVPITIEISGEVVDGYGCLWGGSIYDGSPFTGTYTYDSSAPDTSDLSYFGWYVFDSPYGINVSLGGIEFKTSPSHIGQFEIKINDNGPNVDFYEVRSNQNTPLVDGTTIDWIQWGVYGEFDDEMLTSTDLPITAPVIDQRYAGLWIQGRDVYGDGYNIFGIVSQAELVPEPATIVLMMLGVLLSRRRR